MIKQAFKVIREEGDQILGAVFLGGEEKLRFRGDYASLGAPLILRADPFTALREALTKYQPEAVLDISDEPVVGYEERFKLASISLLAGASYRGADFRFDPPLFHEVSTKPSLGIAGLGKRVGKTAISAHIARKLKEEGYKLAVVAMGRGGPAQPEVLYGQTEIFTPEYLLKVSEQGKHAASDYFEDALMAKVTTVGCRRCGGGMAGKTFISNVLEGAHEANKLEEEFLIFEGSGAALPPIKTDANLLVISAAQPLNYTEGYFGPYRVLLSNMVVITACEQPLASPDKIQKLNDVIKEINPDVKVVQTIFRPSPLEKIRGKKAFLTTTSSPLLKQTLKDYLEKEFGCVVTGISFNLSRPEKLRSEILAHKDEFDVLLTELKAAGVEVATRFGKELGAPIVYTDNIPLVVGGDGNLDQDLVALAESAISAFESKTEFTKGVTNVKKGPS